MKPKSAPKQKTEKPKQKVKANSVKAKAAPKNKEKAKSVKPKTADSVAEGEADLDSGSVREPEQ